MRSTKKTGILILSLALLAGLAGTMACQKKAAETPAAEQMKAVTEFEGTVRAALGRYMYLSTAMGFDIVLPGFDAATLMGKTIKVKGNLLPEHPPSSSPTPSNPAARPSIRAARNSRPRTSSR